MAKIVKCECGRSIPGLGWASHSEACDVPPEGAEVEDWTGCDCTELCSMGPTCPGGMLAGLPDSGCWRTPATPKIGGEVGTGADEGATGQDTGTAWVTRSTDCPEAPAQAHLPGHDVGADVALTEAELIALGFQTPGSGGLLQERIERIIAVRVGAAKAESLREFATSALPAGGAVARPAPGATLGHAPYVDDGGTYCGWATDREVINGCGEAWPCSTVRSPRAGTPTECVTCSGRGAWMDEPCGDCARGETVAL